MPKANIDKDITTSWTAEIEQELQAQLERKAEEQQATRPRDLCAETNVRQGQPKIVSGRRGVCKHTPVGLKTYVNDLNNKYVILLLKTNDKLLTLD